MCGSLFSFGWSGEAPNDPKLSDGRGWRGPCAGEGGRGRRWRAAWAVTAAPVRCSAWLGVAVELRKPISEARWNVSQFEERRLEIAAAMAMTTTKPMVLVSRDSDSEGWKRRRIRPNVSSQMALAPIALKTAIRNARRKMPKIATPMMRMMLVNPDSFMGIMTRA